MSVVAISRGSYSRGREIAERVAHNLGYACISREVLEDASKQFGVSEVDLLRALRDAPSLMDRLTFEKEKYVAFVQVSLLEHIQRDNIVYHGLAGHYFLRGIPHVVKVRVVGEREDRVSLLMEREAVFEQAVSAMKGITDQRLPRSGRYRGMSKGKALRILKEVDEARRRWGLHLYGMDTQDPTLYDMVIDTRRFSIDDAADIISRTAGLDCFQTTPGSRQVVEDLLLAARVRAKLAERYRRVEVVADQGAVHIALESRSPNREQAIREAVEKMPGVRSVDFDLGASAAPH